MKEISRAAKVFCWAMLVVSSLTVIGTIGHVIWNPQFLELQIGVIFAFSALAFNASMLINKIKQKEQRRADDIHEDVWWGMRWTGVVTILVSYGCAAFFLFQAGAAKEFLNLDAGFNIVLALVVVINALMVERAIVDNPDIDPMRSGGKV